jgi:polar amino acid transport system substrate-binding protein
MLRMTNRPILLLAASLALASCAHMTSTSSPAVTPALRAEFAPSGTLVAGVNLGNPVIAQKDSAGGDPRGVGPELARELARRLGVPIRYVTYDVAGKMADAMKRDGWDVAMLAVDPARAAEIDFTAPYVEIEGTYLVRRDSPLRRIEDFDREGLRIAVGLKTAYDLYLTRALKKSELVRAPTSLAAVDYFREQKLDAAAGVKNTLEAIAARDPSVRVIPGNYMTIGQASGVPQGRAHAAADLRAFIEEAKASGFIARKLAESGVTDATVAPPAK